MAVNTELDRSSVRAGGCRGGSAGSATGCCGGSGRGAGVCSFSRGAARGAGASSADDSEASSSESGPLANFNTIPPHVIFACGSHSNEQTPRVSKPWGRLNREGCNTDKPNALTHASTPTHGTQRHGHCDAPRMMKEEAPRALQTPDKVPNPLRDKESHALRMIPAP
jgi:hypothetical protein